MIGSKISVAVADAKGNKDVSDETAPVAVYKDLEILAAEQKGAKTIEATFSEAITGLDKLTVSKNGEELKQAYAAKIADDGLSATITLENRITAGTYTVTLTPADADEDPSSVTFEGEVAALGSIEFVSDYLIMKDNEYKEGYAYIKGYDQFGDEMSLSSVTVIPGYGHFRSYDATTGKITIGVDDDETNFAIVKEVPVFVTYQNGADTIPANATLTVTTMSYVQDLTFGDIYKADGSKVDDDTNPLMIGDLKSKPYVEILDVEDQYGNKLSAKDLNDQATGNTKVLFVIPDDQTTSAYYSTGKFSTITEKDGTKKTILYLAAGGDMPGSMDLIITGASGQSFSKPVTVKDDPYIDVLRVNYPTLYEGTDESDALEFTAVDQYGKEIKDLFNFAPTIVNGDTLKFNDANHLTGQVTRITAPNGVNWVVKKDNINEKFTVTMKLEDNVKKGATLVMMATTAGLKVTPTNLTVGQRTNGESIDTTIGGSLALDPQTTSFDFNKNVRFLSSNGTVMDRVENEQYPVFLMAKPTYTDDGAGNITRNAAALTYDAVLASVTEDQPGFFWTVSLGKEGKVTGNKNDGYIIEPTDAASTFDTNGKITIGELDAQNGVNSTNNTTQVVNGETVYKDHKNATYYVTLYKASKDSSGITVAVIDKQSFKLTYSPTKVDNVWQTGTQYKAELSKDRNIYADADKTDNKVKIRVKAYPNVGQPYYVDDAFIQVTGSTSTIEADPDTLIVTATAAGSATFSVYVKEPGDPKGVYTTIKVTADDKQTATKVQKDFAVTAVDRADVKSKVGAGFTDSSRTATEWTTNAAQDGTAAVKNTVTIKDGQMTITNGNRLGEKLTLGIKDQHDLAMKDAKFFVDGLPYEEFWEGIDDAQIDAVIGSEETETTNGVAKHIIEVRSADDSIIQHYTIELGVTDWNYTATKTTTTRTVLTEASLRAAIADKVDEITVARDIALGNDLTIDNGIKVTVADGFLMNAGANKLTVDDDSTLVIAGELSTTGAVELGDGATITVNGIWSHTGATITGEAVPDLDDNTRFTSVINGTGHVNFTTANVNGATLEVDGSTLVLKNVTFTGAVALGGHVEVVGTLTATAATGSYLLNNLKLELTETARITNAENLSVAPSSTVTIIDAAGAEEKVTNPNETAGEGTVTITNEIEDAEKNNGIASTVKLWVALAKLTKATDTTETELKAADDAYKALKLDSEGEATFAAALAEAVPNTDLDTMTAITTHVEDLLEEAAIGKLNDSVKKQTATAAKTEYKTFALTMTGLTGFTLESGTVTDASGESAGTVTTEGAVTLTDACPDTGAKYTVAFTTNKGNTIAIEATVTRETT